VNLGWLLQTAFRLHGALPRRWSRLGSAWSPIHTFVEVTYRCNLRCQFCCYLEIIEGRTLPVGPVVGDLPLEAIKRRVDEFPRGRLITFSGGDVSVRKDFPQMLAHAGRRHRTHFVSNGALLTDEMAREYVQLAPRHVWQNGLVLVDISLQGGDEKLHDAIVQRPGSWRATLAGIRRLIDWRHRLHKRYPKINMRMVVTEDTADRVANFVRVARSLGVDIVNFMAKHDLPEHSGHGSRPENLRVAQPPPPGVDGVRLRQQLIEAFTLARAGGLQIRLTPYVPIDEFVRHYASERALSPHDYVCSGPWSRAAIVADGRYAVCPYVRTGDMRGQSWRQVWNSQPFREFRRRVRRDHVYAGCHGCCNLRYIGPKRMGLAGVGTTAGARPT
jgi:MoaA/NifB/PqqE/SkfB family radical SAM enzyme